MIVARNLLKLFPCSFGDYIIWYPSEMLRNGISLFVFKNQLFLLQICQKQSQTIPADFNCQVWEERDEVGRCLKLPFYSCSTIQPFQTPLPVLNLDQNSRKYSWTMASAGPHIWVGIFRAGNGKINKILCCLARESAASHASRQCCSCFSRACRSPSPSSTTSSTISSLSAPKCSYGLWPCCRKADALWRSTPTLGWHQSWRSFHPQF